MNVEAGVAFQFHNDVGLGIRLVNRPVHSHDLVIVFFVSRRFVRRVFLGELITNRRSVILAPMRIRSAAVSASTTG